MSHSLATDVLLSLFYNWPFVCPRQERISHFNSPIFCELKTVFRLKIERKLIKIQGFFENYFPLFFSKIFKIILKSSQVPRSIENFALENDIMAQFFDKMNMWGDIMASYLILCLYNVTKSLKIRQGNRGDMWKI